MNVGILVFPNVEELDFVGPWEILGLWKQFAGGPNYCAMVAQSLSPIMCAKGMTVTPHISFEQCPTLDILIVPGGEGTRQEVDNQELIHFISSQANCCKAVLSICTGSFLLHRAGLLSGKKATTHWNSLDRLRALGDIEVAEERFVHDGNIWTAAGVSAGIDAILAFIYALAGDKAAGIVQAAAEYYPSPTRYGEFHKSQKAPAYIKNEAEQAVAGYRRQSAPPA